MKKNVCLLLVVVMLLGLVACGANPEHTEHIATVPTETAITEPTATEPDDDGVPGIYNPYRNWEYYVKTIRSCNSEEAGRCLVASSNLSKRKLHVFAGFLENPVITEEFIDELKLLNAYYDVAEKNYEKAKEQVPDLYFGMRNGEELKTDITIVDMWIMENESAYKGGCRYSSPAMVELEYQDIWCPGQHWDADFVGERYCKGVYELSSSDSGCCPLEVVWHQNIMTPEGQDDTATSRYRQYQVLDSEQEAYLAVACDHSFMMIHIVPNSAEAE